MNTMVGNLSAAIVVQHMLLEFAGDKAREESARSINNSSTYSAIKSMVAYLCVLFFKGTRRR